MHGANNDFWKYVSKEFHSFFNENILEFGSYDMNGTIKDNFTTYKKYVGIDWRKGPGVDVVGLAHDVNFDYKANAILSASMLEHDPHWDISLNNMIKHLSKDGILILSWGSGKNPQHCLAEAPDGGFHNLKVEKVRKHLEKNKMIIHTSVYEGDLNKIVNEQELILTKQYVSPNGSGEHCLIAFHDTLKIDGGFICEMFDEDKI